MLVHWNLVCWVACSTWPRNEFLRSLVHSDRAISSFWTEVNLKCKSGRALSQSFWPGCLSVMESSWLQCFSIASLNAVRPDSGTQAQCEWKAGWRESGVPPAQTRQAGRGRGGSCSNRGCFLSVAWPWLPSLWLLQGMCSQLTVGVFVPSSP